MSRASNIKGVLCIHLLNKAGIPMVRGVEVAKTRSPFNEISFKVENQRNFKKIF